MLEQPVFRLQLIATPGEQEGDLECVLLLELPQEDFDPLNYLTFLRAGQDKTAALYEAELDKTATVYAELQGVSVEEARVELSAIACNQIGLTLDSGDEEGQEIILTDEVF